MKVYIYNGRRHWFEDGKAPEGAVLEKAEAPKAESKEVEAPKNKAVTPRNKSGKASKK